MHFFFAFFFVRQYMTTLITDIIMLSGFVNVSIELVDLLMMVWSVIWDTLLNTQLFIYTVAYMTYADLGSRTDQEYHQALSFTSSPVT